MLPVELEGASRKYIEISLYAFECEIQKRFRRCVGDVSQKWGSGRKMEIITEMHYWMTKKNDTKFSVSKINACGKHELNYRYTEVNSEMSIIVPWRNLGAIMDISLKN